MMRTGTGRRGWVSRWRTFRNPRGSATGHLQDSRPNFFAVGVQALFDGVKTGLQDGRVVARQHLGYAGCGVIKVLKEPGRVGRLGFLDVLDEQPMDDVAVLGVE